MHYGKVTKGDFKLGETLTASIDTNRRKAISRAHSATHLLHKALQEVLGEHVHQAGSYVEDDSLRFDFTHFSALTPEELVEVGHKVNTAILEGFSIETTETTMEKAKEKGAMALFGEKYGNDVRVVDMNGYSVELCGGTHLDNTAKVGVFHITSEFSVAAGVRRIEAITGVKSLNEMKRVQDVVATVATELKTKPKDLIEKVRQNIEETKGLHQMVSRYKSKEAAGEADRFLLSAQDVGPLKVLTSMLQEADANKLREVGDLTKDKTPNIVAVFAAVNDGKITFLCVCGKEAIKAGVKAGDVIKHITPICGGKGGGKPDSAMGGGSDPLKLDNALAAVDDFVSSILNK